MRLTPINFKPGAAWSRAFLRAAIVLLCLFFFQSGCQNDQKIIDRHQQILDEEDE
jgi:hypothetical protein